jgi:hypothetical protein
LLPFSSESFPVFCLKTQRLKYTRAYFVVSYECETWSFLGKNKNWECFGKCVLRKIFGKKREEVMEMEKVK